MKTRDEFPNNFYQKNTIVLNEMVKSCIKNTLMVVFVLVTTNVFSQVGKQRSSVPKDNLEVLEIQKILEVQAYIQSLKSNEIANNLSYSSSDRVSELLFKPQSSIYYYSGVTKTYGEKVTNLFTDVTSLDTLSYTQEYNNVEIITIYINTSNELSKYIDLNLFSDLKKLKYVYIIGKAASNEGQITKMVQNLDPKYGVFYKIPKDDNY